MRHQSAISGRCKWTVPSGCVSRLLLVLPLLLLSLILNEVPRLGASTPPALSVDCTRNSPQCPDFIIQGDDPGRPPTTFRGYADPSMRKDPTSQRLWVAYSWPRQVDLSSGNSSIKVNTVSTHLAHSDDGGSSWLYDMTLWPAVAAADPAGSGQRGFLSSEGPSLIPVPDAPMVSTLSPSNARA